MCIVYYEHYVPFVEPVIDVHICTIKVSHAKSKTLYWGALVKRLHKLNTTGFTFIINLTVSVHISSSHHFIDLFISQFLTEIRHHVT